MLKYAEEVAGGFFEGPYNALPYKNRVLIRTALIGTPYGHVKETTTQLALRVGAKTGAIASVATFLLTNHDLSRAAEVGVATVITVGAGIYFIDKAAAWMGNKLSKSYENRKLLRTKSGSGITTV